jgi:hypothetical protein
VFGAINCGVAEASSGFRWANRLNLEQAPTSFALRAGKLDFEAPGVEEADSVALGLGRWELEALGGSRNGG